MVSPDALFIHMLVIPLVLTILAKVVLPKFVMQAHRSFLEALYLSMRLSWTMHGFWQLGFGLFFSEVEIAGSSDNPQKSSTVKAAREAFTALPPLPTRLRQNVALVVYVSSKHYAA